jgi:hypothetical protein
MKNNIYHFCYMMHKELCTGVNIQARDYAEAIALFNKDFKSSELLYVSVLQSPVLI